MSSHMTSFFRYAKNQETGTQSAGIKETAQAQSTEGALSQKNLAQLKQLVSGQTISGEVIAVRGNEIEILMDHGGSLLAKMEYDMNVSVGKLMSFEVKKNSDTQISLRPLFENLQQQSNILKAMDAASIPQNEKTTQLVKEMMNSGMSVDRNTLQLMHKVLLSFPDANPANLVSMTKLNLPITQNTLQQFEQYRSYEHSVVTSMESIADDFSNQFFGQIQEGAKLAPLLEKISTLFATAIPFSEQTDLQVQDKMLMTKIPLGASPQEGMQQVSSLGVMADESDAPLIEKGILLDTEESLPELIQNKEHLINLDQKMSFETLLSEIKEGKVSTKETVALLRDGSISPYQLFRIGEEMLAQNNPDLKNDWEKLIQSNEFKNILKESLLNEWLLSPEEVALDGKVAHLYEKIQAQTEKILQMLESAEEKNSPIMKSISQLSQNVEFMNHLNQVVTYIQLPLKFYHENSSGELYVYTNKKNLSKPGSEVSALLHLDMEHLGKVDVYVTLVHEKVNTNFKLEKEESLQLIEDNIEILNEHLNKRGYHMQYEIQLAKTPVNVIEELLSEEMGNSLLSQISFDVRA